jgi:hypothetical protein
VKPPRGKPWGILISMAELSVACSPPSLKLRRALLAIHPHGKPWGIVAKESKDPFYRYVLNSQKRQILNFNEATPLNTYVIYRCLTMVYKIFVDNQILMHPKNPTNH